MLYFLNFHFIRTQRAHNALSATRLPSPIATYYSTPFNYNRLKVILTPPVHMHGSGHRGQTWATGATRARGTTSTSTTSWFRFWLGEMTSFGVSSVIAL